jgi:hypothetical protein
MVRRRSTTSESRQLLGKALTEARADTVTDISSGIASYGMLGVFGEAEVGITSLVSAALDGRPAIRLDLREAPVREQVTSALMTEIARAWLGDAALNALRHPEPTWPRSATRRYLSFAERAGERLARYALQPERDDHVTLGEALDAYATLFGDAETAPVLWIDHLQSPGLITARYRADLSEVLWGVRAVRQQIEVPIVLSAHRTMEQNVIGNRDAAFYGDGVTITITRPDRAVWEHVAAASRASLSPMDVGELFSVSNGHPSTMLNALALSALTGARDPGALWDALVTLSQDFSKVALQYALTLHRRAPDVLQRVAAGIGPYAYRSEREAKDVAVAVERLHRAGLISQPRPRAWEITNPVLSAHLYGSAVGV